MSYLDDLLSQNDQQEALRLYHQQNGHQPQQQPQPQPQQQVDPTYAYYMGTGQQQEQPTTPQNEGGIFNGFFRGAKSGGAGVIGGQAGLGNLYGVGDGSTAKWAEEVAQNNARRKEYSIPEMLPFASDYWTNGEGAAYDLGNALGSSAVLGAETAAVMSGVGAVAGALGIGGASATAATAGMSAASRAAFLGQNAVKTVATKMSDKAAQMGLGALSKVLKGPAGQMYALNILRTPFEVSSEMGNAGQDALKDGKSIDEARKRAWITGAVQTPLLAFSNTLETGNLGKILMGDAKKVGGTQKLISALGGITMEAFQNAWEEGMQQSSQEYAADKQSLLGVVNPFQWSPEAKGEAAAGFVSGLGIGGGSAAMNSFSKDTNKKQTVDTPADPQQARDFLTQFAQTNNLSAEEQNAITGLVATGSNEEIINAAQGYGWNPDGKNESNRLDSALQHLKSVANDSNKDAIKSVIDSGNEEQIYAAARQLGWNDTEKNNELAGLKPYEYLQKVVEDDGYNINQHERSIYSNMLRQRQKHIDEMEAEVNDYLENNVKRDENGNIPQKLSKSDRKAVDDIRAKYKKKIDAVDKLIKKRVDKLQKDKFLRKKDKIDTNDTGSASQQEPYIIQSTVRTPYDTQIKGKKETVTQKENEDFLSNEQRQELKEDAQIAFDPANQPLQNKAKPTEEGPAAWQAKAQNDAEANVINNEEKAKAKEDKANKRLKNSMINDAEDGGNAAEWSRRVAESQKQTPVKAEAVDGQAINYRDSARMDNKASKQEESPLVAAQRQMRENQDKFNQENGVPQVNKKDETIVYDKGYEERKATRQRQEQTAKEADKMQLANDKEQANDTQDRQASEQARIDARDKAVTQAKKDKGYYAPRSQAEQDLWSKWDNQIKNGKEPDFSSNKESADRYKNYSTTYQNSLRDSLAPQNKQEQTTYKRWSDQLKKGKKPTVTANEKALYERFQKYRALKGEDNGNNKKNSDQVQAVPVQHKQSQATKQTKTDNKGKGANGKTEKVSNTEFSIGNENNKADNSEIIGQHPFVVMLRKLGYKVVIDKKTWDGYVQEAVNRGDLETLEQGNLIYGAFDPKTNTINLNPYDINLDTPIHEYTHLWVKLIQKSNPKLWAKGKELLKQLKTWNAVVNDPHYQSYKKNLEDGVWTKEQYEDKIASEVMSRVSGLRGVYRMKEMMDNLAKAGESKGLIQKVIDWIGKFFHSTQKQIAPTEDLANMSVWEFINMPVNDVFKGVTYNEASAKAKNNSVENTYSTENQIAEFQVTSGTYFSGGGLVDYALKSIIDGQFAVEKDPKIAGVYKLNNDNHMFNDDVRDFDPSKYKGKVDYFHASPVCKNFSGANNKGGEQPLDIMTAKAVVKALEEIRPKAFTLENVHGYHDSEAMNLIVEALDRLGYNHDNPADSTYNSADFGAATSRDRIMLRAIRKDVGELPAKPKGDSKNAQSWDDALKEAGLDINKLPEKPFAPGGSLIKSLQKKLGDLRKIDKPFLVMDTMSTGPRMAFAGKPAPTILAKGGEQRIFIPKLDKDGKPTGEYDVREASPRVMAILQGLKDYKFPNGRTKTLSYRVVGNGVPVKLTQSVFGPLLKQIDEDGGKNAEFQVAGKKSATADISKMHDAIKMLKAGNNPKTVYDKTGWYIGADKKLKYEIPDKAELVRLDKIKLDEPVPLKDVYPHPELLKAYPFLRDVKIVGTDTQEGSSGSDGIKIPIKNTTELMTSFREVYGEDFFGNANYMDDEDNFLKAILVHEVQHQIQDYEGFAEGDNGSNAVLYLLDKNLEKIYEMEKEYPDIKKLHEAYEGLKYQREKLKRNLNEKDRAASEKYVKEFEDSIEKYKVDISKSAYDEYKNLKNRHSGFASGGTEELFDEILKTYTNISGEKEARATSQKMFLNPNSDDYWNIIDSIAREPNPIIVFNRNLRRNLNDDIEFHILDKQNLVEKKKITELNKASKDGKTFKAYRAMALIDGKLYPPMATKVDSKNFAPASKLGEWEQADENPHRAFYNPVGKSSKLMFDDTTPVKKDGKWQAQVNGEWVDLKTDKNTGEPALFFELRKDNGGTVPARYNPYLHSSKYMLNDQFSSAYNRPNLVVVEMELPNSELTSGYKAEYAKDPVGQTEWKAGPVASQLAKLDQNKARDVYITRWGRPIRIVPDAEVAKAIKEQLGDSGVSIPQNVVTPKLAKALKEAGVDVTDTEFSIAPMTRATKQDIAKMEHMAKRIESGKASPLEMTKTLNAMEKAVAGNDNIVEFNIKSWVDADAKAYVRQQAEKQLGKKDAQELIDYVDGIVKLVKDISSKDPSMKEWQEQKFYRVINDLGLVPAVSAFKKNGEYLYNIDLGTLCPKREAMDAIMAVLIDRGYAKNAQPLQIARLMELLKERGALTTCRMCFVEGKRARVLTDAYKEAFEWESVLKAAGITDNNLIGDKRNNLAKAQLDKLERMADESDWKQATDENGNLKFDKSGNPVMLKMFDKAYLELVPEESRRNKVDGKNVDLDTGITADKMNRIAKLMLERKHLKDKLESKDALTENEKAQLEQLKDIEENREGLYGLVGKLNPMWLLSARSMTQNIFEKFADTSTRGMLASWFGAATAKPVENHAVYDALSWRLSFNESMLEASSSMLENMTEEEAYNKLRERFYKIGGFRAQSFTDFNITQVLDYIQMLTDLEIRGLPIHMYTKVPALVKLFGKTGVKINMSLVPNASKNKDIDENHLGLKHAQKSDGRYWDDKKGIWTTEWDENNKNLWVYDWADESFPPDQAFELRKNEDYNGNIGIIAIGISERQIRAMLADPELDYVIPYHSSGMPEDVKKQTGFDRARDHEDSQETGKPSSAEDFHYNFVLKYGYYDDFKVTYEKDENGKTIAVPLKDADGEVITERIDVEQNPKAVAKAYLDFCEKHLFRPKFLGTKKENSYDYTDDPHYYKLLQDFRGYNNDGSVSQQEAVRVRDNLPSQEEFMEIVNEELGERTKQTKIREGLLTNEEFLQQVANIFEPQPLSGDVKKRLLGNIKVAVGNNNVEVLSGNEFVDALNKAGLQAETFKTSDGQITGFCVGPKIYLNDDFMNANLPAREFTHLWTKVARAKAPSLWSDLVQKLKEDKLAKPIWDAIAKGPKTNGIQDAYGYIRAIEDGNQRDDAIASEVLSRVVAGFNEIIVEEISSPESSLDSSGNVVTDSKGKAVKENRKMSKGKQLLNKISNYTNTLFQKSGLFEPVDGVDKDNKNYYKKSNDTFTASEMKRYGAALQKSEDKRTPAQQSLIDRVESARQNEQARASTLTINDYVNMVLKDMWNEDSAKRFKQQASDALKKDSSATQVTTSDLGSRVEFSIRNTQTSPGTDADMSSVAGALSRPETNTIKGWVEEGKERVKEAKDTRSLDPLAKGSRFREKWIDKYDTISIFDKAILAAQNEMFLKQGKEMLKELPTAEQFKNRVTMLTNAVGGMQHCLLDGNYREMIIAADHYKLPTKNIVSIDGNKSHVSMQMIIDFLNNNIEDIQGFMDACGNENVIQALDTLVSSEGVLEDYQNYLKKHAQWEHSNKKEEEPTYTFPEGTDKAKFEKVVAKAPMALKQAADMYYKFNNDLIHILRHAGVISEKELKTYEHKYKKFCPLMRDFSDTEALDSYIRDVFGGGGVANVTNPLKHRSGKGSSRNILSPVGSTAVAIRAYITRAERNMLAQDIVKTAKQYNLTTLIAPAKPKAKVGPEESVIGVMVDGKKELYEVDRALYGPLTNCFAPTVKCDIYLAKLAAQTLRVGATTSPGFIIRNFLRDTLTASMMSHYNFIPVVDSLRGAMKLLTDKDFRARFEASGIVNSTQFHSRKDAEKKFLEATNGQSKEYGLVDYLNAIRKYVWGKYSGLNELVEASTRAGLMLKAEEAGATPSQAAYEAIYGTVNFNRSGTAGQQVNKVIPFFNAVIQGGDLLYQEIKRDPKGMAFKIGTKIILPSLVLWLANSDEDWYKELDPNIKMNYWCLPNGVRIQKAEAAVIFGSGIEAMMDEASGKDPKSMKHLKKALWDVFMPNFIPTVMLPLIEWQANYSFFRGKPVVNSAMQKLPDELQYGPYTPAGAIWVGKALGQSPDKIYNLWRSITGTMGTFLLQGTDLLDSAKDNLPEKQFSEKPIARDFLLNPNNYNRSISDFFELYDAANKQHRANGVSGKPTKEISEIQKVHRMISKAYSERKKIEADTKLSSTQKRAKTDKIDKDIKRMARSAVDKYGKQFDIT